jgi:membrane protein DedA with SNARE-associated domain
LQFIVNTLLAWGPWGVFVLSVIDSAGIPIPGGVDALVVFLGAMHGRAAYWSAGVAVAGSVIGNLILFLLARKGGEVYLDKRCLSPRAKRFREWFRHYGMLTVFIPALLPIPLPLKIFVLSAGALGIRPITFLVVVLAARIPRYFGLAFLGIQLGTYSLAFLRQHKLELTAGAVVLFLMLFLAVKVKDRMRAAEPDLG